MAENVVIPSNANNGVTDMGSRYALTKSQVNDLIAEISTPGFVNGVVGLFSQPIDNLISLIQFPFDVKALSSTWAALTDSAIGISILTMNTTGTFLNPLTTPLIEFTAVPLYGTGFFGDYRDYAPYSTYEIYLPYIGFEELDPQLVVNNTLKVYYAVDLYSGKLTAYITVAALDDETSSETVIMVREGQIGMQIQLAGGNGAEIARNMLSFGLNTAVGAASLAGGAIAAGVKGSTPISIAGSSVAGINFLGRSVDSAIDAGQYRIRKGGTQNAATALYGPQEAYILIRRPTSPAPSNYNSLIGRPLMQAKTLSTLTGFTVVDSVHVEGSGFAAATSEEKAEIERLLKSGVIL